MIRYLRSILISFLLIVGYKSFAQVKIFVNADVKHEVGGESTFDRSKWMVSHYSNTGINWIGEEDKLDYLINDLDTYFGRETGQITSEVMNRTPADMVARGAAYREEYAQLTTRHQYEAKQRLVIGNQDRIYSMMTGTEAGNRSAAFVNNYYGNGGTDGEPLPEFLELMNEPLFPLHDFPQPGEQQSISQIFQYHKNMATQLKANSPNTQIGGYVAAFSIFEENNFQRWNDRWKFYVDSVGYLMDFYSFHFYDFPGINNGVEQYRKGANNEATLDMFDHYTELVDMQRPWLISEYGSQVHDWYNEPWSSFRDWLFVKALNSMMIQFMERPDKIIFTVPFTVMKAEWGFGQNSNGLYPYQWRMMRRANEPESYSGDWVWTDYIKFYEFWEDVNGTRIDTKPADINLQVDAFVEEDKVYLIVNNLLTETKVFQPVIEGFDESDVVALSKRHLYLDGDVVALTDSTLSYSDGMSTTIAPEATVLLTYTLASPQIVDETSVETKYYASTYLQPISAETSITFEVNGVALDQQGEAVLRIGLGRDHGSSLSPDINLNGTPINAPAVYRGDDQLERPRFFGLLEIDVPYSLLATDNVIELSFPEDGGHVSSMAIQVFNTTRPIFRTPVTGVNLDLDSVTIASGKTRQLTANISPSDAFNQLVSWSSDDIAVATVDDNGLITAVSEGNTLVRVTTLEQDTSGDAYIDSVVVVVDDSFMLQVDSLAIAPSPLTVALGDTVQLTAEVFPVDADIKLVDWESQDPSIAVVDNDGRVVGISLGETTITATSPDGSNISDMVSVLVEDAAFVRFDDNDKYLNTIYRTGESIEITAEYDAGSGATVNAAGLKFWLREIIPDGFQVANDYTSTVTSIAGSRQGTASTSISLEGVPASDQLPEGHFYFLYLLFTNSNGDIIDYGIFPIVIEQGEPTEILVTEIELDANNVELNVGDSLQLQATVIPEDATDKSVSWASDDVTIASVSAVGLMKGLGAGVTNITVSSISTPGISTSIAVSVVELPLSVLETQPEIKFYPSPVRERLMLKGLGLGEIRMVIYSMDGTRRLEQTIQSRGTHEVDVSQLKNGLYLISLESHLGLHNFKFLVRH